MERTGAEAERIARLAVRDRLMALLGITCVDGGSGRAAVSLAVREDHLNFNGTCHGGVTFALADSAFGLASNSHGVIAAAIDAHITYQVAVKAGDTLTASASEVSRSRKLGVYRIDVTRQDGAIVSTFTGTVYVTERPNET
jgi:phenylacetic acid degradation protein PaaD